ncbi:hypothetical protein KDA23_04660, partial [Candidatus Saccharibacteria bacterium]|nr:hypothetical protein [Candidatus Saccharibacteria bacterium]
MKKTFISLLSIWLIASHVHADESISRSCTVNIRDEFGNGVSGLTVDFTAAVAWTRYNGNLCADGYCSSEVGHASGTTDALGNCHTSLTFDE